MSCSHIDVIRNLEKPRLSQSVHREECTQCFDSQVSGNLHRMVINCLDFNRICPLGLTSASSVSMADALIANVNMRRIMSRKVVIDLL